jgi:hypothetical protein
MAGADALSKAENYWCGSTVCQQRRTVQVEQDAAEATRLRAEKKKKDADAAALRAQERQERPAKRVAEKAAEKEERFQASLALAEADFPEDAFSEADLSVLEKGALVLLRTRMQKLRRFKSETKRPMEPPLDLLPAVCRLSDRFSSLLDIRNVVGSGAQTLITWSGPPERFDTLFEGLPGCALWRDDVVVPGKGFVELRLLTLSYKPSTQSLGCTIVQGTVEDATPA